MHKSICRTAGITLAAALLAVAAGAEAPRDEQRAKPTADGPKLMVGLDPATGVLRQPTRDEALALTRRFEALVVGNTKSGRIAKLADGTQVVEVDVQDYSVVKLRADGSSVRGCVPADQIDAWLAAPAPAPAALEVQ